MSDDNPEPKKKPACLEIIDARKNILKEIIKCPEKERELKIRSASYDFFDEDLTIGRNERMEILDEGGEDRRRNVFGMALKLVANMPERRRTTGITLITWHLQNLFSWLETNNKTAIQNEFLTDSIRKDAVYRGSRDLRFSELICKVFDVSEEMLRTAAERTMNEMLEKRKFKEAAEYAITNRIVDDYTFEQLVLPLLLADKNQVAYEVLNVSTKMQKAYVAFFDEFLEFPEERLDEYFEPYRREGILLIKLDRFRKKSVMNHMQKFFNGTAKQYKYDLVEERDAPKYEQCSKNRALRFYIRSRFEINSMSDVLYFQHIEGHLRRCLPEVTQYFLDYMWTLEKDKRVDAIFWVKYLEFPESVLPSPIIEFLRNPDEEILKEVEELAKERANQIFPKDGEQLFVVGNDSKFAIHIIKSENDLDSLCSEIESLEKDEDPVHIGLDSEWKPPNLTEPQSMRVALVQLFFCDQVWLVDCVTLENPETGISEEKWLKFAQCLLGSKKIKIVGFDVKNDLDAFLTIPALKDVLRTDRVPNAWCLKKLAENVCEIGMDILGLDKKTFKLADLAEKLLGLKLDKSEQCSNWQCRPLRKNQIVYAAMDAVVVDQIFKKVLEKAKSNNVDIDRLMAESNMMAPKKEEGRKKWRKLNTVSWTEIYETLHTHRNPNKPLTRLADLKIIVDLMLLGVGKNLKCLGIDVYLPKNYTDFQETICKMKEANEQRYILTVLSKSYDSLRLDHEDLLVVMLDREKKSVMEQLIDVFDNFNIDIRIDDDFVKLKNP